MAGRVFPAPFPTPRPGISFFSDLFRKTQSVLSESFRTPAASFSDSFRIRSDRWDLSDLSPDFPVLSFARARAPESSGSRTKAIGPAARPAFILKSEGFFRGISEKPPSSENRQPRARDQRGSRAGDARPKPPTDLRHISSAISNTKTRD
jgi:hypothetical protein